MSCVLVTLKLVSGMISFIQCKWVLTNANLAKFILEARGTLTLLVENCRGQGYYGAGALAGNLMD